MLAVGRDPCERARSRRRILPRAEDHRGLMFRAIHQLSEAFRRGETTPTAVTETYLDRIKATDDRVGAYLTVTRDQALTAAAASDRRYADRRPVGPLDGVPVAIKDVFCTRGIRTTCGSKILETF